MPLPLLFFRSLLLNPRAVGALAPSSPKLCQLMASVTTAGNSYVVEIGAGTGAITEALLERNIQPERLLVIERDPALAAFLETRFPGVRVRCGDAIHLSRILNEEAIEDVSTIVSSVPLRNLSRFKRLKTVRAMMKALSHGGQLVQYTYITRCPIPIGRLGLEAECLGHVWRNLPPARVWRFTVRPLLSAT